MDDNRNNSEDVVVDAIRQIREIDETVVRDRWRETSGLQLEDRVRHVVGGDGPLCSAVIGVLRGIES